MIASLFCAIACDVIELTPQNALSDATAFTTPERIELTVVGVYDAANSGFYLGGQVRGYPFGAAHVEQGDCRGEDVVNTQLFYAVTYESTYDPTTANNDFHWQTLYALINRANVVLEGLDKAVPSGTFTQAKIDEYKGECRFLRALAHHELLKHFARPYSDNPTTANSGVPYKTMAAVDGETADISAAQERNTIAECYALLIADLDYAESVLPETRAGGLKLTRATKAAAVALKTRIYLHKGDWSMVVTEGNKLADELVAPFSPAAGFGTYSLTAAPFGPFGAGNKNNTESIFSVENSAEDNPGVNGALPAMYNVSKAPISGRGLVGISPVLWNQNWFLASDLRKSSTFTDNDNVTSSGKGAKFTKKYADATSRSDNAPVMRYAEVLLNMAEAIQRLAAAPDPRAFALYNAVRTRSVSDPATDNIADFASANALIQSILNERRIEFVCEGLRWGDIHRLAQDATFGTGGIPAKCSRNISNYSTLYTGDPATTFSMHAAIPYSDRRFVWPIPSSETAINTVLAAQQNPGY